MKCVAKKGDVDMALNGRWRQRRKRDRRGEGVLGCSLVLFKRLCMMMDDRRSAEGIGSGRVIFNRAVKSEASRYGTSAINAGGVTRVTCYWWP